MGLTYSELSGTFTDVVGIAQEALETELNGYDPENASSADLVNLQFAMQKWTMTLDLSSNTLKTVGEGMRNTVANIK